LTCPGSRRLRFLICACFLFALAGLDGEAQEPQRLYVSFTFRAPRFVTNPGSVLAGSLTAPQRAAMEAQISASLASILADRFPYWSFQPGRADMLPRLSVWVEKGHPDWEVRMALIGLRGEAGEAWRGRLFAPGDLERLEGLPASETWQDSIRAAFDENLMAQHQKDTILGVLQESIPLGLEVVPVGPLPPSEPLKARAVLPLNWDKHCRLAKSEFRVIYRWASEGEVTLHSVGIVGHFPFKPGNPVFEGITIKHNNWEFGGAMESIDRHLKDLGDLTPVSFYLKRFVKPNELAGSCSAADVPPMVAP
jgi:hypothetical protein